VCAALWVGDNSFTGRTAPARSVILTLTIVLEADAQWTTTEAQAETKYDDDIAKADAQWTTTEAQASAKYDDDIAKADAQWTTTEAQAETKYNSDMAQADAQWTTTEAQAETKYNSDKAQADAQWTTTEAQAETKYNSDMADADAAWHATEQSAWDAYQSAYSTSTGTVSANAAGAARGAGSGGSPEGSREGFSSFFDGAIKGDFSENDSWSTFAGQVIGGLNPVGDARDVAANAKNVWQGKEGGWFGLFIAGVGVIPLGGDAAKVALKGTRKGLTGAAGGLAQQAAKHANDAGDLAKSAKASVQSPRAARRAATREAGIPTSQQPISQKSVRTPQRQPAGRQYTYETPKPGGGTRTNSNSVQHSLTDQVEGHGPHWEAGPVKPGGQMDSLGRPRIQGGKVKVNE